MAFGNPATAGMVFGNPQAIYGSVVMAISKDSNSYRMVTDYRAVNGTIEQAAMPMPTWKTKRLCSRAPPYGSRWMCCKAAGRCR